MPTMSVVLARTLASQGASAEEINSVLESLNHGTTHTSKPAVKKAAKAAPKATGKRGHISQAIASAVPSGKGKNFSTKDLVAVAQKAGSKNLGSAQQMVNVFLSDALENGAIKRTSRGNYITQ